MNAYINIETESSFSVCLVSSRSVSRSGRKTLWLFVVGYVAAAFHIFYAIERTNQIDSSFPTANRYRHWVERSRWTCAGSMYMSTLIVSRPRGGSLNFGFTRLFFVSQFKQEKSSR